MRVKHDANRAATWSIPFHEVSETPGYSGRGLLRFSPKQA